MVSIAALQLRYFPGLSPVKLLLIALVAVMIPVALLLIYFLAFIDGGQAVCDAEDPLEKLYGEVIAIVTTFRHGARTAEGLAPKDPYNDLKYWPEGYGQLTKEGVIQQYRLGKCLSQRYKHLLPENYMGIHKAVYVASTDWDRTLMSAQAQLAGWFPTDDPSSWDGLLSLFVPIHSIPEEDDSLLEVTKKCPAFDTLTQEIIASPMYQEILTKYADINEKIKENAGLEVVSLTDYENLYGIYFIEEERGLVLPDWLDDIYLQPLKELCSISLAAHTWTDPLRRLRGGPFIKEVISNFREKWNNDTFRRISMYSAHDTSLAAFMSTLGVFNNLPVPFAATLIFELRKNDQGEAVVTVQYVNSTETYEPILLTIPNCTEACPLGRMETILKPVIPEDWEKECQGDT